jgi:hypothetical protein
MARKRAEPQPEPLRFRGAPAGLEGFAPTESVAGTPEAGAATLRLPSVAELASLPVEASPLAGGTSYVRLSLPPATPPGTYDGTLRVGDGEVPVVAEVEPYPSLQLAPTQLQLEAEPGADVEAHVTALNDGNVPLEIAAADAFGLFDVRGAERSIRAAFTADTEQGERRIDRLVDELAGSHGGLVRVKVAEGAGPLAPGELRPLRLVFRVSETLERGQTYSGTWPLHSLRYYVRVVVPPAPEKKTTRGRTR